MTNFDSLKAASAALRALDEVIATPEVGNALARSLWFDARPAVTAVEFAAVSRWVEAAAIVDLLVVSSALDCMRTTIARSLAMTVDPRLVGYVVTHHWEHLQALCPQPIDDVDVGQIAWLCARLQLPGALSYLETWARSKPEPWYLEAVELAQERHPEAWIAGQIGRGDLPAGSWSPGERLDERASSDLVASAYAAVGGLRGVVNSWIADSPRGLKAEVAEAFGSAGLEAALQVSLMIAAPWQVVEPEALVGALQDPDSFEFVLAERLIAGAPTEYQQAARAP